MKFSLIYEAQTTDASREGDHRVFKETVEQALLAEQMGFDTVWCVEHTSLTNYAHMSAPETFLAYLAGRTTRIGLGHGVICLPPAMNHPIKVAERVAMLDILSGGRVHFGVGKGGSQQEAGAFGYDLAELQPMIDESMYLVPKMFVQDEIEHDGKYIKIPKRPIHPKPFGTRIRRCTWRAPTTTACCAPDNAASAHLCSVSAARMKWRRRTRSIAKHGRRASRRTVGFRPTQHLAALCPTVVMSDGQQARKIGIRGQRYFMESLAYWYTGGERPDPSNWGDDLVKGNTGEMVIRSRLASEEVVVDFSDPALSMMNPNHAYGTVDDCIGYVGRLMEAGVDEVLFLCQMGTVPQEAQLETIRNIGEHVIPYFNRVKAGKQQAQAVA